LRGYLATGRPTPAEARQLRQQIEQGRVLANAKRVNAQYDFQRAKALGAEPEPILPRTRAVLAAECAAGGIPFNEADPVFGAGSGGA
jgi:hypothetical protein